MIHPAGIGGGGVAVLGVPVFATVGPAGVAVFCAVFLLLVGIGVLIPVEGGAFGL
ncbi:hypothetical protein [Pseudonocardia humida]|uniref:Uncharacterized protein n=1 Tax=Pseudonocardia humida TaxID=2800819 RepID=A0ABT0ZSU0_9PSEU|nr:hypothetical protein [Pseudonocardia humida]MCO1653750.1 hypothetical protein [Pseudonocardia humida]